MLEFETEKEESWEILSGCHTCINKQVCNHLGNCVILSIDIAYPEYNKWKRKIIQKIKSLPFDYIQYYTEILLKKNKFVIGKQINKSKTLSKSIPEVKIRLTNLEKLFIESLNKKR